MSNKFGEDLKDNLLPRKEPIKKEHTKRGYTCIPQGHEHVTECSFRMKNKNNHYFINSRFIVWRDKTAEPNQFYWERLGPKDQPSYFKFGPFNSLKETHQDILELYGLLKTELERAE